MDISRSAREVTQSLSGPPEKLAVSDWLVGAASMYV